MRRDYSSVSINHVAHGIESNWYEDDTSIHVYDVRHIRVDHVDHDTPTTLLYLVPSVQEPNSH